MTEDLAELKELYPHLSEAELTLAKENLDRYLSLAWEIFEDSLMESRAQNPASLPNPHLEVGSKQRSIPKQTNHLPNL